MKNIIFDIDGTLWDSTDVVAESWNEAIWEKAGIKANLDGDKLKKLFGKTMDEIGRLMLPTLDDEKRAEVCQACYDYEDAYLEKHSGVFYDGVIDTLNELVATNDFDLVRLLPFCDFLIELLLAGDTVNKEDIFRYYEMYSRTLQYNSSLLNYVVQSFKQSVIEGLKSKF